MSELYIGLMSGTSMDGIDAALVEFKNSQIKLVSSHSHPIPKSLKKSLRQLSLDSTEASIDMLGEADTHLGLVFAEAVKSLLNEAGIKAEQITAIGSHGQTIRHRPDLQHNFSMQIGDANRISYLTGITTVADFRRKDMAAGGEGAPLAPAFHQQVFHSEKENRAILNIGGISNITFLPKDDTLKCFGFDTGPGNMLMDAWIQKHKNKSYDNNGLWAASSTPNQTLVNALMQDAFISTKPPKSTGREHYHLDWLEQQLQQEHCELDENQIQASLCQFTSDSIIYAIENFLPEIDTLIVCGGGAHNSNLMNHLSEKLMQIRLASSEDYGIHPDWVEAIAFAWLAKQTINNKPGNLPAVTGAETAIVLGAIYPA
ncbi:MAG: anhydro-N-acetylmuramic acid kinase [endosymbiont of Galathealinum brachiosum]|uniref:Anhydro-N-acetylmuramic acid kinase n=1 Tax=endosymbiont of Galathealinum brachiosum TaxID=2200906 RepID=A0A370DDY8_9GAMM|nr:MAG: anhydro-N-acetylmuramic acid kinase [endosymbiont of Galathealinum brachiosum]